MSKKVFFLVIFFITLLAFTMAVIPTKKQGANKSECCKNLHKNCKEAAPQPTDNMIFENISRQFITFISV
jgi:hypothetical protein